MHAVCATEVVSRPFVLKRSGCAIWIDRHSANRIEHSFMCCCVIHVLQKIASIVRLKSNQLLRARQRNPCRRKDRLTTTVLHHRPRHATTPPALPAQASRQTRRAGTTNRAPSL